MVKQQSLPLGHMIVEIIDDPKDGKTFGFFASVSDQEKKKPAFSGPVEKGIAAQLRLIAAAFDFIEKGL